MADDGSGNHYQKFVSECAGYAYRCHNGVNHKYGDGMYTDHLLDVVDVAKKFITLIPESHRENILAACWCHDVIKDCRQTYNDVKNATNEAVADIVYVVTTEKGKNRKERANDKYYAGIRKTRFATFVKLCDRIANYQYSKSHKSNMATMYEKEMPGFIEKLYDAQYKELFDCLSPRPPERMFTREEVIALQQEYQIYRRERGHSIGYDFVEWLVVRLKPNAVGEVTPIIPKHGPDN